MTPVYILRHKATGLCMPQLAAGHSWWEPLFDDHSKLNPRLFWSQRSAQNARSAWARGPWKADSGTSVDWEGVPDSWYDVVPGTPAAARQLEDLEIVPLMLTEVE